MKKPEIEKKLHEHIKNLPEAARYSAAYENGFITEVECLEAIVREIKKEYILDQMKRDIEDEAADCAAEGYPAHGSNFELRAEGIRKWYEEMYPEYF